MGTLRLPHGLDLGAVRLIWGHIGVLERGYAEMEMHVGIPERKMEATKLRDRV